MERSREPLAVATATPEQQDELQLSQQEAQDLAETLSLLSGKQFKAVRLDAAGVDTASIASAIGVVPATISNWRKDPYYLKARTLFISIINRQGLKFRLDCQRQILAPVYTELMRRMAIPGYIKGLDLKNLLDTLRIVGKETRLDAVAAGGGSDEDEDLQDLQNRRKNFSVARQAQAVDSLKKQEKIIQFPTGTDGR
jgi:hypothetical protein